MIAFRFLRFVTLLLAVLCVSPAQSPGNAAAANDEIWAHFEKWVRTSPATPVRPRDPVMALYVGQLVAEGVPKEEAERRKQLIADKLRPENRHNSMVYWDAMFKYGGGPDRPLRILADLTGDLPAGSALDVAMGNGRNSVYLASKGWKVTGYDISPEALALARYWISEMGVRVEIAEAGHREFNFGTERWDLIVLSYIVADSGDLELIFGQKLWQALRPGGRIVCEGNFCEPLVQTLFPLKLKGLRLERYSDGEELRDGWGANDEKGRVIKAIIHKLP